MFAWLLEGKAQLKVRVRCDHAAANPWRMVSGGPGGFTVRKQVRRDGPETGNEPLRLFALVLSTKIIKAPSGAFIHCDRFITRLQSLLLGGPSGPPPRYSS